MLKSKAFTVMGFVISVCFLSVSLQAKTLNRSPFLNLAKYKALKGEMASQHFNSTIFNQDAISRIKSCKVVGVLLSKNGDSMALLKTQDGRVALVKVGSLITYNATVTRITEKGVTVKVNTKHHGLKTILLKYSLHQKQPDNLSASGPILR